jgi:CBS domain-containing protein
LTQRSHKKRASDRFLEAFNQIDKLLRKRIDRDRRSSFHAVVDIASAKDASVATYATDLKEFADLRNAIVHESTDGQAIAEPHKATVVRLETILERLSRPPKLEGLFLGSVAYAEVDQPVGQAAKVMFEGNFSQMPVYEDSRFVELLTAETIARWLAHELSSGIGLLEEAPIRDVLLYTEDVEHYLFRGRKSSAFEALADFEGFAERGKSLDAILITNSGNRDEKPIGILTTFDIPKLLAAVDSRHLPA